MANKFVSRTGLISLETSHITGSLFVSGIVSASNLSGSFYGNGNQLFFGDEQQTADVRYLRNVDFNTFSASVDSSLDLLFATASDHETRIFDLEAFSSSLDATFATEAEVSGYVQEVSTSFETTINTLDTRVTSISESFDTTIDNLNTDITALSTSLDGRLDVIEGEFSTSVDARLDDLESFSASLDNTYATEAELNAATESVLNNYGLFSSSVQVDITQTTGYTEFSNSIDVTTDALDVRVTDLETFSASMDNIFATEAEVSGYVESVSASFETTIDNLSSSLDGRLDVIEGTFSTSVDARLDLIEGEFSTSVDTRLDDLESFSASLDTTFATEAEVSGYVEAVSTSFETTINNLDTRVTNISESFDTSIDNLNTDITALSTSLDSRLDYIEGPFSTSVDTRLDDLESFSASLDATYATEAELNAATESVLNNYGLFSSSVQVNITQTTGYTEFSNSIDTTTDALDVRVTDLETFSASMDNIFATEAEVSGYVESVSTSFDTTIDNLTADVNSISQSFDTTIDNLSASLDGRLDVIEGTFSTSVDIRLGDLESFSSSLDATYATEAEVSGYVESVSTSFDTTIDNLNTDITALSTSLDGRLDVLEGDFSTSVDTRLDDLETFSASLDNTFATEAEVSGYVESVSTSFETTINNLDTRVTNISTSFDTTIDNLTADVNSISQSFDTTIDNLNTDITALSTSLDGRLDILEGTFSTSVDIRLDDLESFSASLDNTFATEAEVSGYVESVSTSFETTINNLDTRVTNISSSFDTTIDALDADITALSTSLDSRLDVLEGEFSTSVDSRLDDLEQAASVIDLVISSSDDGTNDIIDITNNEGINFAGTANEVDITISGSTNTIQFGLTDDVTITNRLSATSVGNTDGTTAFTGSFSGSFVGDGSGLTNVTIANATTYTATFNSSSFTANHTLNTENVIVAVYDENSRQVWPGIVEVVDANTVFIDFQGVTVNGYIVIAKAGHIVSGSFEWDFIINKPAGIVSESAQVVNYLLDTATDFGTGRVSGDNFGDEAGTSTFTGSFSGDGSNLTGIVTSFVISGSDGTDTTVALKTEALIVSGTANETNVTINPATDTLTVGLVDDVVLVGSITAPTVSGSIGTFGSNVTVGGTLDVTGRISSDTIGNADGTTSFTGSINGIEVVSFSSSVDARLDTLEAEFNAEAPASVSVTGATQTVRTVTDGATDYDAIYFDYVVKSGTNLRAGTIIAVWDSNGNVEYFDNSTQDLGSTSGIGFEVIVSGTDVVLRTDGSSSGTWTVKTTPRGL